MSNLADMSVEELIDEQRFVSVARGEAEAPFKAQGQAVRRELNLRASTEKLEAALSGLTPEQRAKVLGDMQAQEE
jgi:hypothetical protein